jgi:hypothetical protein
MNIYTNTLIIYLVGVLVAAFGIRNVNSKLKFKQECIPAPLCLLSWFVVLVIYGLDPILNLIENILFKIDFSKINKFFKYTDKE